jgi:hypothetical protein
MGPITRIVDGVEQIIEIPASLDPTGITESVVEVTGDLLGSVAGVLDEIF